MEKKILNLFLYNHKLKFNEIEKNLRIRSNKLAYHLKNLVTKGILSRKEEEYSLSEIAESLLPYLSEKKSILPVILVHIGDNKKTFLCQREKRPFKDKLSLPGGRILLGESIQEATKRVIKEKYRINCKLKKINSVSLEKVIKNKNTVHAFFLIFVSATTKEKIELTEIEKNKKNIISSDYKLLMNDLDKKIEIKEIKTLI
jgi:ADP-ribose pyrophosphatase YjhB (NUDIX family)